MDMFVQMLDEGTIDQITRIAGGARQQVSTSGMKNAFAGLNEFIRREIVNLDKSINEKKRIQQMPEGSRKILEMKEVEENIGAHYGRIVKMMKAFVIYDATVAARYDHTNANKVRFSETTYNTTPGCSGAKTVRGFIEEVRGVIGGVAGQLGMEEQFRKVHENIPPTRKTEWDAQTDTIKNFNSDFSKKMDDFMKEEGIEKLSAILMKMNHLTGLIDKKTERKAGESELEEIAEAGPKKGAEGHND